MGGKDGGRLGRELGCAVGEKGFVDGSELGATVGTCAVGEKGFVDE